MPSIKHCSAHYRNINAIRYEQWTDDTNIKIEQERKKHPEHKFIMRGGRMYRSIIINQNHV